MISARFGDSAPGFCGVRGCLLLDIPPLRQPMEIRPVKAL